MLIAHHGVVIGSDTGSITQHQFMHLELIVRLKVALIVTSIAHASRSHDLKAQQRWLAVLSGNSDERTASLYSLDISFSLLMNRLRCFSQQLLYAIMTLPKILLQQIGFDLLGLVRILRLFHRLQHGQIRGYISLNLRLRFHLIVQLYRPFPVLLAIEMIHQSDIILHIRFFHLLEDFLGDSVVAGCDVERDDLIGQFLK